MTRHHTVENFQSFDVHDLHVTGTDRKISLFDIAVGSLTQTILIGRGRSFSIENAADS
jgi:hypothetical protein